MAAGAPASIAEAVEWLRKHFDPEAAGELRAGLQFHLTGPDGGSFHASLAAGSLVVAEGELGEPDVSFRLSAADLFGILGGRENGELLFLAGRMQVEGNLTLALKLRLLFPVTR
jgi:predicted lipid carrier protein YhbT